MIGKSLPELIFIRICIIGLRAVAPTSILYLISCVVKQRSILPIAVTTYASLEAAFLLFVYLPRKYILQQPAQHPEILDCKDRDKLFRRCANERGVAEMYSGWFLSSDIGRQNVREWILWALFSSSPEEARLEWEGEIERYIQYLEDLVDRRFESGDAQCMRLTLDPVLMLHRPLLWYMIVGAVDSFSCLALMWRGFKHYNSSQIGSAFPPRPLTVFSTASPSPSISFWYRLHKSKDKLPIVFIHGIGIGMWPYGPFLHDLIKQDPDVGIVLVEILPISMHITSAPLPRELMTAAVHSIVLSLDISQFVLASHSYGTVVSAHLLHDPILCPFISSVLLVDPIPFLLHLPDIAYNFVYRHPRTANEWQLWYFASRDPDISRALSRHFFWAENMLWKEELQAMGKKFAVALSGKDQIVNAEMVRKYLTEDLTAAPYWKAGNLEVLFNEELDHATVFDTPERRKPMLEVLERFVRIQAEPEIIMN